MHIAIDARIINSTTGRYIERLLTYLEKLDSPHQFSVLVRKKDIDYWVPKKANFRVVVADYKAYGLGEQIGFYWFLQRLKPDLVHFCMPQQPFFYTGRAVTTVHDLNLLRIRENDDMSATTLRFKQRVFRELLHTVLRRANHIITPTNYVRDDVIKFHKMPLDKISVTYESADLVANDSEPVQAYTSTPFILMVGRTETYKNHRGVIESLQALLWKNPKLRLVIVGKRDQSSHDLEQWALTQGYRNVDFFGFASNEQLAWLYEHCQAYIFASFMEGFGLPGLEAMKHGAPVASSNASCLPEVYGDAAAYFDPADTAQMSQVIGQVLNNTKLRKQLIEKGKKQSGRYSWKRMATQTLDIYDSVITNSVER
jgi:glycosyltransferase involved in cell wall biosynthesis